MSDSKRERSIPLMDGNRVEYRGADRSQLSGRQGGERTLNLFQLMQRGLVYPSPFARFATFWIKPDHELSRAFVRDGAIRTRELIHERFGSANTSAVVGVEFDLFRRWCEADGLPVPAGIEHRFPAEVDGRSSSNVFERSGGVFQDSGAALFVHIKSDDRSHLGGVYDAIVEQLGERLARAVYEDCDRRDTRDSHEGKVLGCRFSENLNNPADPITLANHTLVGYEDVDHAGASYVLAQRFLINWEQLHNMTEEQIEDTIGRTTDDILIPTRDPRSHIKSARQRDARGNPMFVMRLGLPFGRSKSQMNPALAVKGSNLRDEEGIYFAGYAKSVQVFEAIMDRQIGDQVGDTQPFMNDRLFNHVKSDLGGFFYIPSRADLDLPPADWTGREDRNWASFPGVDWSRVSRHFRDKSPNGRMFYNHKNYLYEMAMLPPEGRDGVKPPSTRVLNLLLDSFTRWQDTWYFEKGQPEMGHLCQYVAEAFGDQKAGEVMGLPIVERKAWSIRMTCRLYASEEYGYRGKRTVDGREQEGADTYRIHPMEIIVGALPDLSLGQGRYVMPYLRGDEELPNFFRGLNEASGVGHVIPDHQRLVEKGIGGLLEEIEGHRRATEDADKRSFYNACTVSLEGVQDLLRSYADLAEKMAGETAKGQAAERDNLEGIVARLRKLAVERPETLLEAVQLIFTLHTCLQLNGEPVSLGRLDQYLQPFYEADRKAGRLTEDEAQEILDAFCVKLDEKVLQNRLFMQDHQPYGNLAMGGASGPYPQTASLGQWIQQVTVGGVVGDDAQQPTPAYNDITRLFIRSAARLPLNAPCLSLRVRKEMPRDLLEEAADALLSGGAHPILLHDDKIVDGMRESGSGVGDGAPDDGFEATPVREKAAGKWRSEVSLADARNYACDGCYEPMFTGQNWFSLGGFSTLIPLECALNQGRTYASAGPVFLRGRNESFRSRPAGEIKSFEELEELYFDHFYHLAAKSLDGQLNTFDALVSVCPTPLLSVLTDDCLAKGLDLYGGGARYNVYAPCFIALSTTINSLYNIKKMVFDESTAVTSLPELVECLLCDWGEKMVEPMVSSLIGPVRTEGRAERYRRLRAIALSYPRFGRGHDEVDELGREIIGRMADTTVETFRRPAASTAEKMLRYAENYGTEEHPFGGFQLQPGIGTFENFVAFGSDSGAAADGRHLGEWIASDLSPSPSSEDRAPEAQAASFSRALDSYSGEATAKIWDGAPVDFNIDEEFPRDDLVRVLNEFADGRGSNILTVTCASEKTLQEAPTRPERYDLLRVRMGGWSEFFTSMFPQSQRQHQHRPRSTPGDGEAEGGNG